MVVCCVLSERTAYMRLEGKAPSLWVDESSLRFCVMVLRVQEGMSAWGICLKEASARIAVSLSPVLELNS